jgi:hypothetical protein
LAAAGGQRAQEPAAAGAWHEAAVHVHNKASREVDGGWEGGVAWGGVGGGVRDSPRVYASGEVSQGVQALGASPRASPRTRHLRSRVAEGGGGGHPGFAHGARMCESEAQVVYVCERECAGALGLCSFRCWWRFLLIDVVHRPQIWGAVRDSRVGDGHGHEEERASADYASAHARPNGAAADATPQEHQTPQTQHVLHAHDTAPHQQQVVRGRWHARAPHL